MIQVPTDPNLLHGSLSTGYGTVLVLHALDRNGDKVGARFAETLPTSVQNQLSTRSGTENQCDCTDTRVCLCQKNKEFFEILSMSHTKYGPPLFLNNSRTKVPV